MSYLQLWVVLAFAASLAVPIADLAKDAELTREKRSPGGWHSPPPEGEWKKKLVWKVEWQKAYKHDTKLTWKTEWVKEKVPAWKTEQVQKWHEEQVPAWKIVKKSVWHDVQVPIWKEVSNTREIMILLLSLNIHLPQI